jgi:hypothetical protein
MSRLRTAASSVSRRSVRSTGVVGVGAPGASLSHHAGRKYRSVLPSAESYTCPGGNARIVSHSSWSALSSDANQVVPGAAVDQPW